MSCNFLGGILRGSQFQLLGRHFLSRTTLRMEIITNKFKGDVRCQQTKTCMKGFFALNSFVNIAKLKKLLLKAY